MTTLPAGWKPISSAPMDGTTVLLFACHVDATASTRVVGSFDNNGFGWIAQCYVGQPFARLVPSHWMELPPFPGPPPPPASAQDDAKDELATFSLPPTRSLQPVATAFFTEKGEVAYTGIYDRTVKALEAVKKTRMGISAGSIDLYTNAPAPAPAAGDARTWQGLTDAERDGYVGELVDYGTDFVAPLYSVVESIEKRLREKNAASQQQEG